LTAFSLISLFKFVEPLLSKIVYNADGRISQQIWPTGLAASNLYDTTGTLVEMRLAPSNQSIWKRGTNNARGQFTQVAYGNNIQTRNTYEPQTGLQTASQAGPASSPSDASIINHSYPSYNPLGHLLQRLDSNHQTNEIFSYDSLNRLTSQALTTAPASTPASLRSVNYSYNALGNILTHSDVGQYVYGTGNSPGVTGNGPHTLRAINGQAGKVNQPRYTYDQHGNITQVASAAVNGSIPNATRTHSWTSFDNPQALSLHHRNTATNTLDTNQVSFLYGSDHQRIREVTSQTIAGVSSQKTLAILHPDNAGALYFERETINTGPGAGTTNAAQNRHYLSAEKGAFLLITSNTSLQANPTPTTLANAEQRYWHKDHLGSIVASTNQNLTVIERLAYEPFGKRRFANGQYDQAGTIDAQSTNRGFTGHEHLDSLDFIHMNARVYDPDIGRFLSPDPTVPYTHNPQSFNRFSYVMNNPLNRYDPDGFADLSKQSVLDAIAQQAAAKGNVTAGKAPNATTPAHEAITANNPADDGTGQSLGQQSNQAAANKGNAIAGLLAEAIEFTGGTPMGASAATGKAALLGAGAMMGAKAGGRGLFGSLVDAAKGFFGHGPQHEQAAKGVAVEVNAARVASSETTRVGRWMSKEELGKMQKTGKVQESKTGTTHVANPANTEAYGKQAKPGSVYAEFDVPASSVKSTQDGWGKIAGPNSLEGRNATMRGREAPSMPNADNISVEGAKDANK
jgi:RHS repeat-associated protein